MVTANGDFLWMGLTDKVSEGQYFWETSLTKLGSFAPWDAGQPDNYGNNEDCIHTKPTGWNDVPCTANYRYVCQMDL